MELQSPASKSFSSASENHWICAGRQSTALYGTQSCRKTAPPPPAMARFQSSANIAAVPARRCELSAPTSEIGEIFCLRFFVGNILSISGIIYPVEAQKMKYLFRRWKVVLKARISRFLPFLGPFGHPVSTILWAVSISAVFSTT